MKRTSSLLLVILLCCSMLTACSNKDETLVPADLAAMGLGAEGSVEEVALVDALLPQTITAYGYRGVEDEEEGSVPKRTFEEYEPWQIVQLDMTYGFEADAIEIGIAASIIDEELKEDIIDVLEHILIDYDAEEDGLPAGTAHLNYAGQLTDLTVDINGRAINPEVLDFYILENATEGPSALRLNLEYTAAGELDLISLAAYNERIGWDELAFYGFSYEYNQDASLAAVESTLYVAAFALPAFRTEFSYRGEDDFHPFCEEADKVAVSYTWTEISRKPEYRRYSGSPNTPDGVYWSRYTCHDSFGWFKSGIAEYISDDQGRLSERIVFEIDIDRDCRNDEQLTDPDYDNAPMVDYSNEPITRNGWILVVDDTEPLFRTVNNYDDNSRLVRIDIFTSFGCGYPDGPRSTPKVGEPGVPGEPPYDPWGLPSFETLFTYDEQGMLIRVDVNDIYFEVVEAGEVEKTIDDGGYTLEKRIDKEDSCFAEITWALYPVPETAVEALNFASFVPGIENIFDTYLIAPIFSGYGFLGGK